MYFWNLLFSDVNYLRISFTVNNLNGNLSDKYLCFFLPIPIIVLYHNSLIRVTYRFWEDILCLKSLAYSLSYVTSLKYHNLDKFLFYLSLTLMSK